MSIRIIWEFFAAALGTMAFALLFHVPRKYYPFSGIFPLVPGAGIYWTAYYMVTNELDLAGQRGFQTVKIAVAIVLSILLVIERPQKVFSVFGREKSTAAHSTK